MSSSLDKISVNREYILVSNHTLIATTALTSKNRTYTSEQFDFIHGGFCVMFSAFHYLQSNMPLRPARQTFKLQQICQVCKIHHERKQILSDAGGF